MNHQGGGGRVQIGHGVQGVRAPGHAQSRVGGQSTDEGRRQEHTAGYRRAADDEHDGCPR